MSRFNQRQLSKRIPHWSFWIPLVRFKRNSHNWTVFKSLQFLFGLFRSEFNAYNLKSLLGPNVTSAKVITSAFFSVFSQNIFHVLLLDFFHCKPPSTKSRKHSFVISTPHSLNELNLLNRKFENFHGKFSSTVHNNSSKHRASSLPTSNYECYVLPVESHQKIDYQSLTLHTLQSIFGVTLLVVHTIQI